MGNFNNKIRVDYHCMIDIEALAQSTDASILTIGAICFDPYVQDIEPVMLGTAETGNFTKFYKKVSIDSCDKIGLTVEDNTLAWWSKQSQEVIDDTFSAEGREDIADVLKELFLFSRHCTLFWAKSPQYDMTIIETAAKRLDLGVAWNYYQLRDVRTIEEVTGLETKSLNSHDAIGDAMKQAAMVQKAYAKLGLTRPVFK